MLSLLAIAAILIASEVVLRPRTGSGPGAVVFNSKDVVASRDPEVAHLTPVLAPGVSHTPVFGAVWVYAKAGDGDNVVGFCRCGSVIEDAARVVMQRLAVNRASNWTASVELREHFSLPLHLAILCDCGVWEGVQGDTLSARSCESRTCTAGVERSASVVSSSTRPFFALFAAGRILHAGVEWNEPRLLNELVRSRRGASVARSSNVGSTVKYVLNGEVDVDALSLSGNLDAIT